MRICQICNRISATDSDHTDCMERRRIEADDAALRETLPERLNQSMDPDNLGVEIKAVLEHLAREKTKSNET